MMAPLTSMGSRSPFSISGQRRPWAASRAVYITPVIRTRSPAFNDSTSASVSGVRMSLTPSAPVLTLTAFPRRGAPPPFRNLPPSIAPAEPALEPLESQRDFFVPVRMAFDSVGGGLDGPLRNLPQDRVRRQSRRSKPRDHSVTSF